MFSDSRLNSFCDSSSLQNINNQLCKVSVKARLGCPMGRGGMMELRGQKRGGGGRRGLVKGFYTRKSEWESRWDKHQHYIISHVHACMWVLGCRHKISVRVEDACISSLVGVQKGWSQQQHGGIVNWTGPVGNRGGGAIRKTGENMEVCNTCPNNHT